MKRKNFILIVLMFLFINILSIAAENPTTLSDGLSLVDSAYQEALKDYKPNFENIDKIFDYIEKNIKEKGRAIFYSKLTQDKKEMIVSDENNVVIYTEKIPEKLAGQISHFKVKQTYQLKNGKTFSYSEMETEMLGKKVKIKSEFLMKKKMNKKDAIKSLNLIGDLNNTAKNFYSDTEYLKSEMYNENNNLILTMNYKNNKMIVEQQIEGNKVKMINYFDSSNPMSGKLETYINGNLVSIMEIKNSIPEGEAKMFYPSGKLLSIFNVKKGKPEGMMKAFFENGKTKMIINFKNGVPDGETIEYDEDGNILEKVLYKNGKIVK
ncbi:toxin-antitoxin system YwqK family antitoxin [Fusobacterium animalis]|uniref:toxin-antitoxin system YwqK family antitoxin n=1 Tax=Fusobacterium animalis TaxID=76859 RepID=UPI001C6E50EB|nr:toxin-antitoxin system YwqK family antitoxin [Fusobacterium animalis]QYR64954.1 toxin-antitoxin system YwqK family antitoxin [Fusobacterium animalis]